MKNYFSHDFYARTDPKLIRVIMKHGMQGYGIFWCIVEMLYEEDGYLNISEYERISFELRIDLALTKSIINDFDLFVSDGSKFWNDSILERIGKRIEKSEKARVSVENRWKKYERNTNVSEEKYERNTIKEKKSKVKEIKAKENKENIIDVSHQFENEKNWKNDFDVYLSELRSAYHTTIEDKVWMDQQAGFYNNLDVQKSIVKACTNFWATEGGWKHKKKSKVQSINWKTTFANSISQNQNKVYYDTRNHTGKSNAEDTRAGIDALEKLSYEILGIPFGQ